MRFAMVAVVFLAGCTVQKAELNRPYVTARIDSAKPAAAFAQCSAAAMGLSVRSDEGVLTIVRSSGGVQVARWDFLATNNGSQAELRTGARDDAGLEIVRGCA